MAIQASATTTVTSERTTTDIRAMSIATTLFFMWGFLTCLNDILIPHLKAIFELGYRQAFMVQVAFFLSYFIFALPSGKLVDRVGYKLSMVIGLAVMATGALLFLPAASMASFYLFLGALATLAAGITLLQVAANPYVASLGPVRTASSRLNFSQAFNSLGTTIAPYLGGILILGAPHLMPEQVHALSQTALQAYRSQQASSVRLPYLGLALVLLALAGALASIKLPPMVTVSNGNDESADSNDTVMHHPWALWGAVCIFLYVGAEVSIGSGLVNYFGLPKIMSMNELTAAKYVSYYWGGAMIGRFIGSWILQKIKAGTLLGINATAACLLVLISVCTHGSLAMWTILLVGFFNSVMFSNIFTLGLYRLGSLTSRGSSLLVMAIVGGAIIPLLVGAMADVIGLQNAFILPAICYVFIAIFGFAARRQVMTAAPVLAVPTE